MLRFWRASTVLCAAAVAGVALLATATVAGDDRLIRLGEKLFFDTRLSGSGRTACATCHEPRFGFAQRRAVAVSDNGQLGRRNAPTLLDVGYNPWMMWDGRFPSLEHQIFGPFSSGEMGNPIARAAARLNDDPEYVRMFEGALGQRPTPDNMARAIAAFERTIVSRESRVDRFLVDNDTGILSPLERDGYDYFTGKAHCTSCHHVFPVTPDGRKSKRPLFTDFQFHNTGVGFGPRGFADRGRHEETRNQADWGAFRTPPLRNSARTPPYMHDGSLGSLEEVVEFYSAGGQRNPNLSPAMRPLNLHDREKAALVAFMRAMSESE
jgi:cytochrome c peroxidase